MARTPQDRPWPVQPLLIHSRITRSTLARVVGVDPATVTRRCGDGLTLDEADHWAHQLGVHPAEVWDSWNDVDSAPEALDLFEAL